VTLIELMVSLAVLIILLMLGPQLRVAHGHQQGAQHGQRAGDALAEARSQAIRLGKRVTVCKSDGSDCATSGDWSQGWITFVDTTRSGTDCRGGYRRNRPDPWAGCQWRAGRGAGNVDQFVSYAPDGQAKLMNGDVQTGTLRVCSTSSTLDDDHRTRDLALSGTGRISVTQSTGVASSCDAPD
jgi:type IV fimbrial biogenesis protein FimT